MARPNVLLLSLLFIATVSVVASDYDSVYIIYVRTGLKVDNGGTEANISLVISDKYGNNIPIKNLKTWGAMGPGHHYFENGGLDTFSGMGPPFESPVCLLSVTSDGTGDNPSWYLEYVEVTTVNPGVECVRQHFNVNQWLAYNKPPYDLTMIRNNCESMESVSPVVGSEIRKNLS